MGWIAGTSTPEQCQVKGNHTVDRCPNCGHQVCKDCNKIVEAGRIVPHLHPTKR